MKTKVYFHYEPNDRDAVTIPVVVDEDSMLENSLQLFIQTIQNSNADFAYVLPRHCSVKLENNKSISLTSRKTLLDLIGEETDLFLTVDRKLVEQDKASTKATKISGSTTSLTPGKPSQASIDNFEQSISLLKDFMTKRLFKRGRLLCEKIMLSADFPLYFFSYPTSGNIMGASAYQLHSVYVYQCLMEIHYNAKRFLESVKLGQQLIHLLIKETTSSSAQSSSGNHSPTGQSHLSIALTKGQLRKFLAGYKHFQFFELLYLLAKACFELKHYEKCLDIVSLSIEAYESSILNLTLAIATAPPPPPPPPPVSGKGSKSSASSSYSMTATSSSTTSPSSSHQSISKLKHHKHKIHFYLNMISLKAETTYLLGEHLQAANILNSVMDIPLGDSNLLILKTYILFTFQYFKYTETMSAVLKTIAIIGTESKKLSTLSSTSFLSSGRSLAHTTPTTTLGGGGSSLNHHTAAGANAAGVAGSIVSSSSSEGGSLSEEKGVSKARQQQKPSPEHKKQRHENYLNQNDSDDDELDANQQIYDYEYPQQMKIIKQLLIKFLLTKEGFDQLMKRLPPNSRGTAEIYAYLATIAKEFSAMDLSVQLYEIALQIQSNSINYTLNLIHIYELSYDYTMSLEMIHIFCAKNLNLSIGKDRHQCIKSLFSCAEVIDLIQQNHDHQLHYRNVMIPAVVSEANDDDSAPRAMSREKKEDHRYLYYRLLWQTTSTTTSEVIPANGSTTSSVTSDSTGGGYATVERYVFKKEPFSSSMITVSSSDDVAAAASPTTTTSSSSLSLAKIKIPKIQFLSEVEQISAKVATITTSTPPATVDDGDEGTTTTALTTTAGAIDPKQLNPITFFDRELDLIALIATMVKIYYLQGSLSMIPLFIDRLETIRRLSCHPLHKTFIRNELAYYQDIVQILVHRSQSGWYGLSYLLSEENQEEKRLQSSPSSSSSTAVATATVVANEKDAAAASEAMTEEGLPLSLVMEYALVNLWQPSYSHTSFFRQAREQCIYICGDSHCLSLGWNIIKRSAQDKASKYQLLVPKLVTGVKQWHLRNESSFYPKQNYYNAMNESIPTQSEVILLIGEIDCREGFLVALERDYYDSIEDAMNVTIRNFLHNLQTIRAQRQLKVYIHPIPPVLPETRKIVMLFNFLYQRQIEQLNDPNILWLDFLDDLIDRCGKKKDVEILSVLPPSSSSSSPLTAILSEEYQLKSPFHHDGTHLHPRYVAVVEKALNRLK